MRFNPNTYNPVDDSTPGLSLATHTKHANCVVLVHSDATNCPCGCDTKPKGGKSKFVQGHDARLKGVLIRAHLTGTKVVYMADRSGKVANPPVSALAIAKAHGWDDHLAYAKERFDARPVSTPRVARPKVMSNKDLVGQVVKGKVGRWVKDVRITKATAKAITGTHVDGKGNEKEVTIDRDKVELPTY